MKIEAEILSVINGEIRQLSIGGQIIDIVPPEPVPARKYKKRNDGNYDKTYKMKFSNQELRVVMDAISTGSKTMDEIVESTKYPKHRCNGIIHYLKNKKHQQILITRNGTKITYKKFITED